MVNEKNAILFKQGILTKDLEEHTIIAPSLKGECKISLVVNNLRQNIVGHIGDIRTKSESINKLTQIFKPLISTCMSLLIKNHKDVKHAATNKFEVGSCDFI